MLVRYGNYTHVQTLMKLLTFLSMIQIIIGMTFRVYSHFSNSVHQNCITYTTDLKKNIQYIARCRDSRSAKSRETR